MPKRQTDADDAIARLALNFIDLRAHFEAQLRTITHSEQCLLKCRRAVDADTFNASAESLRREIQVICANRESVGTVLEQSIAEARALRFVRGVA
jgi:hypothetical protein